MVVSTLFYVSERQEDSAWFLAGRLSLETVKKIGKRGQLDLGEALQHAESLPLNLARRQQSCPDLRQGGIVVSRVRHQFPGARGKALEKGSDGGRVKRACGKHAKGTVGRCKAFLSHNSPESWLQSPQEVHLRSP